MSDRIQRLLVGTYTGSAEEAGIYVCDFDYRDGKIHIRREIKTDNPSFIVSTSRRFVYAVNENSDGAVSSFGIDQSGDLSLINRVSSGGSYPCHLSTDPGEKLLFVCNYGSGILSAIPINDDGSLSEQKQTIAHLGSSIDIPRQESSHLHCSMVSPDKKLLFVTDLGTDKIMIYKLNVSDPGKPLDPYSPAFISLQPGSGPRHIAVHPNNKFIYVINEINGTIDFFIYSGGKPEAVNTFSMVQEGFDGAVSAADIHISPDGKFLYASNRGDANEIVIFSIDISGQLAHKGSQPAGLSPRNFMIDPSGNFLIAANQDSSEIITYKIDPGRGTLIPASKLMMRKPVCVNFT